MGLLDPKAIAVAYGGEVRGDRVFVPSLGHSGRDRGTAIKISPTAPDGVLVHCFNGEDPLQFKDDMRAKGLLPPLKPTTSRRRDVQWKVAETYEYDDGEGNTLYRTKRLEDASWQPLDGGKPNKSFRAERYDAGRWIEGLGDTRRVPYRLTELRDAIAKGETVCFVEGERKADKLIGMGLPATAIAFGANGWRDDYADHFRGATVCILPDNDDKGRDFAKAVFTALESGGAWAFVLELPDLPPKGDIVDWTGEQAQFRDLMHQAFHSLEPAWLKDESQPEEGLRALDLAALAGTPPTEKAFAIAPIAPVGETTLFSAAGSAGKSLLAHQFATAAAASLTTCLGMKVAPGPSIYLTCEDDAEQLHWRQAKICGALGVSMASLAGKLHLVSLRGGMENHLATFERDGTLHVAPLYERLVRMIEQTKAQTIWLDNLSHLYTGDENDRGQVTRFINLLNRLSGETGTSIILLGHTNKSGDSWSGSTAWLNAVRSQFTMEHDLETDIRTLTVGKANYSRKGEAFRFVWMDGAFVREDDLPPDTRAQLVEVGQANAENEAFLACLRERKKQGIDRAVGPNSGPNYAPSQFEGMPQARGMKKDAMKRAMDRLFGIGKLVTKQVERPGKSGSKTIIVEAF